jgi:hypothetical protein
VARHARPITVHLVDFAGAAVSKRSGNRKHGRMRQ